MRHKKTDLRRRDFLKRAASFAAAMPAVAASAQGRGGRVVVVGGGFAGATCARFIKRMDQTIIVTLAEAVPTFFAWPMSNAAIAGLREFSAQEFGYQKVTDDGVTLNAPAVRIEPDARLLMLSNGTRLSYDRMVLAPGIDLRWDALPGYTESAAERMPHGWKTGSQALLLRAQLESLSDGGTVFISVPPDPIRFPIAAYERAESHRTLSQAAKSAKQADHPRRQECVSAAAAV